MTTEANKAGDLFAFTMVMMMLGLCGSVWYYSYTQTQKQYDLAQTIAADTSGVVRICRGRKSRLDCVGSAVLIDSQVALTASHVAVGTQAHYIKFHDGTLARVEQMHSPDFGPDQYVDEYPVVLILKSYDLHYDQSWATIGNLTPSATFAGMSRTQVSLQHGQVSPLAELNIVTTDQFTGTHQLYYESLDPTRDTICAGDSGGGLFNSDDQLFGLLKGRVTAPTTIVKYAAEGEMKSCGSSILQFVDLRPYTTWINDTAQLVPAE